MLHVYLTASRYSLLQQPPDWYMQLAVFFWKFVVFMGSFVQHILETVGVPIPEAYTGVIGFLVTLAIILGVLKAAENTLKYIVLVIVIIIILNVITYFI